MPTQDNTAPQPAPVAEDVGLRETNTEVVEDIEKGALADKELIELTEEELKYTNEAIRLIPIRRALGVAVTDTTQDEKIKGIIAWAKNKGIKNRNHLLSEIRHIDYKLGNPDGKPKIDKVYQYVRIESQIRGLVNKQVALEHGN